MSDEADTARDATTPPGDGGRAASQAAVVSRFNEDYAFALIQMGFPRMPARVLVALFTTNAGRLTAAELADSLQASPAAVSGAVRYLIQLGLIRREGTPGSRRHYYRVPDDCWEEVMQLRDGLMSRWAGLVRDGVGVFGGDTPVGRRLADTAEFLEFLSAELPDVMRRWQQYKRELNGLPPPAPTP